MNYLNTLIEKGKQEKENYTQDVEILLKKNEEFKLRYEELTIQFNELTARNRKLEILSKIDKNSPLDYGTSQ